MVQWCQWERGYTVGCVSRPTKTEQNGCRVVWLRETWNVSMCYLEQRRTTFPRQAGWCVLYYFVYCVFRKYLRKKSLQLLVRLLAFVALLMLMHAGWPSVPLVCRGLPPVLDSRLPVLLVSPPALHFLPSIFLSRLMDGLAWPGVGGMVLVCLSRSGPIPKLNLSVLGIISNTVPDSDNKVFIGGLPYNLTEDQVRSPRPSTGS